MSFVGADTAQLEQLEQQLNNHLTQLEQVAAKDASFLQRVVNAWRGPVAFAFGQHWQTHDRPNIDNTIIALTHLRDELARQRTEQDETSAVDVASPSTAEKIFGFTQSAWRNLPGKSQVAAPLTFTRDLLVDQTANTWNRLPGTDYVEAKVDGVTDRLPFNNVVDAGVKAFFGESEIVIDQDGIAEITADPAWQEFQRDKVTDLVEDVRADHRYGKDAFEIELDSTGVEFGGDRGSLNPLDPTSAATWDVASEETTWLLRHADVQTVAVVDADGTITINYKVQDTFDLRPGEGRSLPYNVTTAVTGTIWHDFLGAEESSITAETSDVIHPGQALPWE